MLKPQATMAMSSQLKERVKDIPQTTEMQANYETGSFTQSNHTQSYSVLITNIRSNA